jgi:hypothetical protein
MKIDPIGNLVKQSQYKPNQSQYKPKTNPIPEKPKMNLNFYSTKDYENDNIFRLPENKPNQTQFQTGYLTALPGIGDDDYHFPVSTTTRLNKKTVKIKKACVNRPF